MKAKKTVYNIGAAACDVLAAILSVVAFPILLAQAVLEVTTGIFGLTAKELREDVKDEE